MEKTAQMLLSYRSSNNAPTKGDIVRIKNLRNQTCFNGKEAEIIKIQDEKVTIQLQLRVNIANIEKICKRTREFGNILLVGDSILDNRAYTENPTGLILKKRGYAIIDNAVEESQTIHFSRNTREVPRSWYNNAKHGKYPYENPIVNLFPDGDIDAIFVSIGGNDVILGGDVNIQRAMASGNPGKNLGTEIATRVNQVLDEYSKKYPKSYLYYILPYKLDIDMAKALGGRLPSSPPPQIIMKILNTANDVAHCLVQQRFNERSTLLGSHSGKVLTIPWRKDDVKISECGIPEPHDGGALRLADMIEATIS